MPRLACWSCGRALYTVSPIEALFAEERRCPRCGAYMNAERREAERRRSVRRRTPAGDPGLPAASGDRRVAERRRGRRRADEQRGTSGGPRRADSSGWTD